MSATDVSATLQLALQASGLDQYRPRLLSDNGPSYLSSELSHWLKNNGIRHGGLFGGAFEPGKSRETALRRELQEDLGYAPDSMRHFTNIEYDFECLGGRRCIRVFYEVKLPVDKLAHFRLTEGRAMEALGIADILLKKRVVPYDSFALWMHHASRHRVI